MNKYQIEYEQSQGCFWEKAPAKYVKLFHDKYTSDLMNLKGLDIGAGEGKNTVFLAAKGCHMTAIDISSTALSRFNMQPNYNIGKSNIETICNDLRNIKYRNNTFDIVIAYGVLHCLSSNEEVKQMLKKIKSWIKVGGYFICATFTDEIAPPEIQSYLEYESFLPIGMLEFFFADWDILEKENAMITETHPTSQVEHSHSIVRLIARKNE